jgi:predicted RNase H-like HicB family nuclease
MLHYVAIVEDAGPDKAIGVWFPDLPGCFSAGDDVDEALRNAEEALALYAEAEAKDGRGLPNSRTLSALKNDPAAASDLGDHMVALVKLNSDIIENLSDVLEVIAAKISELKAMPMRASSRWRVDLPV